MSEVKIEKSEILTLNIFDSREDECMLDIMQKISAEDHDAMGFNNLEECVRNLERKDSGINLSFESAVDSNIDLQVNNLDDTYKGIDLSNIDFGPIKGDNIFLQNVYDPQEGITHERSKTTIGNVLVIDTLKNFNENFDKHETEEVKYSCTNENIIDNSCIKRSDISVEDDNVIPEGPNNSKTDNASLKQTNTCEQCYMTFTYKRHLDRHLEGHEKNNCPHCNAKFARRKHLEVHLFRIHNKRSNKYPYTCDVCSHGFAKRVLLDRHIMKHGCEKQKVDSELSKIMTKEGKNEQMEQHCQEMTSKCPEVSHIKWVCDTHTENDNNYRCNVCNITFTSRKKITNHYKEKHRPSLTNTIELNNAKSIMKTDSYFNDLNFTQDSNENSTKASFSCSICSKELISQRALVQHVRRIHKEDKRFTCNMYGCTFQSTRRTDLDRHKQLHIEQRNVICEQCGKRFTSVSILNDHVLYVHNKERQFVCEECGKAFKRNSLLKRHKLSHQQVRPFACVKCNAAFKRSHHLSRHMESCHKITLKKKQKVVKFMKAEDGHLVPVPEKSTNCRVKKLETEADNVNIERNQNVSCSAKSENMKVPQTIPEVELTPCNNNEAITNDSKVPSIMANLASVSDSIQQVLSLVHVQSGHIFAIEVTSPNKLPATDLAERFEMDYNEILTLPEYQDLELQTETLNSDQSYCDANYAALSLHSTEDTSSLLHMNNSKIDSLSTIDNYLTVPTLFESVSLL